MRNYIQVILNPDRAKEYDCYILDQIRSYWNLKIEEIPPGIRRAKGGFLWLQQETGVDSGRIRRLFKDLKIDPHKKPPVST